MITVGGGNTANMLDVWRRQGLGAILWEAWENGAVLTGGSAGGLCWFRGGTTDSFGLPFQVLADGLGVIDASFCPHYDAEDSRGPVFAGALLDGTLQAGYGVEIAVLRFHGRELIGAVSSDPEARAVHLAAVDGRVVETPIPVTVLTASGLALVARTQSPQ